MPFWPCFAIPPPHCLFPFLPVLCFVLGPPSLHVARPSRRPLAPYLARHVRSPSSFTSLVVGALGLSHGLSFRRGPGGTWLTQDSSPFLVAALASLFWPLCPSRPSGLWFHIHFRGSVSLYLLPPVLSDFGFASPGPRLLPSKRRCLAFSSSFVSLPLYW